MRAKSDGLLSFVPRGGDSAAVVDELDVLLTGGRLSPNARRVIVDAHAAQATADEALQRALELIVATAEFHVTNVNALRPVPRRQPLVQATAVRTTATCAFLRLFSSLPPTPLVATRPSLATRQLPPPPLD